MRSSCAWGHAEKGHLRTISTRQPRLDPTYRAQNPKILVATPTPSEWQGCKGPHRLKTATKSIGIHDIDPGNSLSSLMQWYNGRISNSTETYVHVFETESMQRHHPLVPAGLDLSAIKAFCCGTIWPRNGSYCTSDASLF